MVQAKGGRAPKKKSPTRSPRNAKPGEEGSQKQSQPLVLSGNPVGIGAYGLLPDSDIPEDPHAKYDKAFNMPYGSIGCDPEDHAEVVRRLKLRWNNDEKVTAMRSYALRNLGPKAVFLEGGETNKDAAAVEIIQRVFADGSFAIKPAEQGTVDVIKNGMRDYIDYALDEVDRYTNISKTGSIDSFLWRDQGHVRDVPCLRRSMGETAVTPDVLAELVRSSARVKAIHRRHTTAADKTMDLFRAELRAFQEEVRAQQASADQEAAGCGCTSTPGATATLARCSVI